MIRLEQAIVVEGKYDKIKLQSLVDATIIQTNGFRIYQDKQTLGLLRTLAAGPGIVILTDSDHAGFQIRRYLVGAIGQGKIYHAYIPDILGKERRKAAPSKEGTLGVEGVPAPLLMQALERAGVLSQEEAPSRRRITKLDLFEDGLTGGEGSEARRTALKTLLGLPAHLTTNAMLSVLNAVCDYETYREIVARL